MTRCVVILFAMSEASVCNITAIQGGMTHGGRDYHSFPGTNATVCQRQCCQEAALGCRAFTWTSFQPTDTGTCTRGSACCWLKTANPGAFEPKLNCTSGEIAGTFSAMSPRLTSKKIIAVDETGALRDPSPVIQDPKTGDCHFWVVYIKGPKSSPGWKGYLQHWSAPSLDGPFVNHGIAMNHSIEPDAWDNNGMFSPSAIYDEQRGLWFLFYSGTGTNHSRKGGHACAQLVASSATPAGPWQRLGLVAAPTGKGWNANCVDSGRAMVVNGQRGWWTNGVYGKSNRLEGAYFPAGASFEPPFFEWSGNPIYHRDGSSGPYMPPHGFENCEFFAGPAGETVMTPSGRFLHVWCNSHSGEGQPHWVVDPDSTGLRWTYIETLPKEGSWADGAEEPTPAYVGGMPGDAANVTHFIARTFNKDGRLVVGLYSLGWAHVDMEFSLV